jgi:hypothetical protein
MSDKLVHLPALIGPESPVYFFVDATGRATRLDDMADDERARREDRDRIRNLRRDAIIRQLEARESNLGEFPYTARPATHRQIVNKTYNVNGVRVKIRGDEPSIRSIINVLNTYPPRAPTRINDEGNEEFIDLNLLGCDEEGKDVDAPAVGMEKLSATDPHIAAIMKNGDKFSGSGTLMLVTDSNTPTLDTIYVPLYRDTTSGHYSSLGGRIDMPDGSADKELTLNILYNNARRETREESADLIHLSSDGRTDDTSRQYVDIDAGTSPHKYRAYIYYLRLPIDNTRFKTIYNENAVNARNMNFGASYLETDDVVFLSLSNLIARTSEIANTSSISTLEYGNYLTNAGMPIKIRGRTVRVLHALLRAEGTTRAKLNAVFGTGKNATSSLDHGMNHIAA